MSSNGRKKQNGQSAMKKRCVRLGYRVPVRDEFEDKYLVYSGFKHFFPKFPKFVLEHLV